MIYYFDQDVYYFDDISGYKVCPDSSSSRFSNVFQSVDGETSFINFEVNKLYVSLKFRMNKAK